MKIRSFFMLTLLLFLIHGVSAQDGTDSNADLAKKAQNPIADMISVPFQYNSNFGIGPHDRTQHVLTIQPVVPFNLSKDWLLVTRWILPVVYQPDVLENSGGTSGLGDLNSAFWFAPSSHLTGLPEELMIGFGPGVQVPTATDSNLGTREWGLGPSAVAVYSKDKWLFGGLVSNTWSLDDSAEATNAFLIEPFVTYSLNEEWYLISDSVITADWNAPSSERWVLPIGGGFGRVFNIGKQPVNMSLQAYWNTVNTTFGPDWNIQFSIQFLFPK